MRSADRGRTFTSISGNLPDRHPVWAIVQDHMNGNLLFAGTEFGLFFTADGGTRWVQLKGGLPVAQVRDLDVQKRETDLALGTFGRSFYVLDDYSALREVSPAALAEEARLLPLRQHVYQFPMLNQIRAVQSDWTADNPPYGALFTYHVREAMPAGTALAISIRDTTGREVARVPLDGTAGLRRAAWNLTATPPPPPPTVEPPDAAGRGQQAGRGGRGGRGGGRGGRGGDGPPVEHGRYTAVLLKISGETTTPLGPSQSFYVVGLGQR
jgi:hypothetical protein